MRKTIPAFPPPTLEPHEQAIAMVEAERRNSQEMQAVNTELARQIAGLEAELATAREALTRWRGLAFAWGDECRAWRKLYEMEATK